MSHFWEEGRISLFLGRIQDLPDWKMVRWVALGAVSMIIWVPVAPVPMRPTRCERSERGNKRRAGERESESPCNRVREVGFFFNRIEFKQVKDVDIKQCEAKESEWEQNQTNESCRSK